MARRRRFEFSGLVAGLLFLAVATGFACDVAGVWHLQPVLTMPVVGTGMVVVAIIRGITNHMRRRTDAREDAA